MPKSTLVLLPGLLNTSRVFEHQIAALSDIADCIALLLLSPRITGARIEDFACRRAGRPGADNQDGGGHGNCRL